MWKQSWERGIVPLLSQYIFPFHELLLRWGRRPAWHGNSLIIISAQFLTTPGPYIHSPPSSQLTCVSLQTLGYPNCILFEVLFLAFTGLLAPFSASSKHFLGAKGLWEVFSSSLLVYEHIFVFSWHTAFVLFRLNMSLPHPPEYSSSIRVLMLSGSSDRRLPLAHNTLYITFTSLQYDVGYRDLKCIL